VRLEEELQKLNNFGVTTEEHLIVLLKKRIEEVVKVDRSPMDGSDINLY